MTKEINPNHYTRWKIQPIDFCRANKLGFCQANIIKYIMRYDAKDGVKDLDKAIQYLEWLKEDWIKDNPEYPLEYCSDGGHREAVTPIKQGYACTYNHHFHDY